MNNQKINFSNIELNEIWEITRNENRIRTPEEIKIISVVEKAIDKLSNDQPFHLQEFLNELIKQKSTIENNYICMTLLARLVCLAYVKEPTQQTQETLMKDRNEILNFILGGLSLTTKLHMEANQYLIALKASPSSLIENNKPEIFVFKRPFNIAVKCFATALFCLLENNTGAVLSFSNEKMINALFRFNF